MTLSYKTVRDDRDPLGSPFPTLTLEDGDGSIVDDVAGMVLGGGNQQKSSGGGLLGGLLGGLFGKK